MNPTHPNAERHIIARDRLTGRSMFNVRDLSFMAARSDSSSLPASLTPWGTPLASTLTPIQDQIASLSPDILAECKAAKLRCRA